MGSLRPIGIFWPPGVRVTDARPHPLFLPTAGAVLVGELLRLG